MTDDLIDFLSNSVINESDKGQSAIDSMLKGLARDLKFNMGLVFTFGVGIRAMYPIVDNLIQNGTLKIEANTENIVLICLAALTITYLEETNNKAGQTEVECSCKSKKDCEICGGTGVVKSIVTKKDAQTILEELKLRGVGNGIIRKMVECFKSIGNISKTLFKNSPYVINGLMDMLAYTGLLLPTMNAISALIGKYDLNMDTLPGNFMAVGLLSWRLKVAGRETRLVCGFLEWSQRLLHERKPLRVVWLVSVRVWRLRPDRIELRCAPILALAVASRRTRRASLVSVRNGRICLAQRSTSSHQTGRRRSIHLSAAAHSAGKWAMRGFPTGVRLLRPICGQTQARIQSNLRRLLSFCGHRFASR